MESGNALTLYLNLTAVIETIHAFTGAVYYPASGLRVNFKWCFFVTAMSMIWVKIPVLLKQSKVWFSGKPCKIRYVRGCYLKAWFSGTP